MNWPKCVLCNFPAITTAAQIPVCEKHWTEYVLEARKALPLEKRPVYLRLLKAQENRINIVLKNK